MMDPSAASSPSTSDNRSSLIKEYERKLDKFLLNPKIVEEVSQRIYCRDLIQLLREIIATFHTVLCPVSEAELRRIKIDRKTMPPSKAVDITAYKPPYRGWGGVFSQSNRKHISDSKTNDSKSLHSGSNANDEPSAADLPSTSDNRSSMVKEYERKLDKFLSDPKIVEEVSQKIYCRDLIQLLRDIVKIFHIIQCPISEQELCRIGIDRSTMPSSVPVNYKNYFTYMAKNDPAGLIKYYESKLSKALADPKNNLAEKVYSRELIQITREINQAFHKYPCPVKDEGLMAIGILSDEKRKALQKESRAKTVSSERFRWNPKPVKLRKSQNPWKPAFFPNMHLTQTEKITREIRGILNKLSSSTFDRFSTVILRKHIWNNLETLPAIVEVIFSKAIEDQVYVEMFADLCLDLYYAEENVAFNQCNFLSALARQCQIGLNSIVHGYGNEFAELEKKISTEYEKKKEKLLKENLEEMKAVKKWRSVGILRFIAHLCQVPVLSFQTIQNCINRLIYASQESESNFTTMIEFMIFLIKLVGPHFARNDSSDEYVTTLNQFVEYLEKQKPLLPSRMKYLVMNLSTLRDNGWKKVYVAPIQMNEEDEMNFDEELLIAYKIHG